MNNRLAIPALAAVMAALSVTATAQVTTPKTSKTLPTITGWSHDSDAVLDVATDADGNRYLVGQSTTGATVNGFLVKTNKRGVLAAGFPVTIDLAASEAATAVAVDSTGNIFVGTTTPTLSYVSKYSSTGTFLSGGSSSINATITDMAIGTDDSPVTTGAILQSGTYNDIVMHWLSDGTDWDTYAYWGTMGSYNSVVIRPDGIVAAAGVSTTLPATAPSYGTVAAITSDFASGTRYNFTATGIAVGYTEVIVDPTTNLEVGVGRGTTVAGGAINPRLGTALFDSTLAGPGFNYSFDYSTLGGGYIQSAAATSDGGLFLGFNAQVQSGTPVARVGRYTASTTTAGQIANTYTSVISGAAAQSVVDLAAGPGAVASAVIRDETVIGTGPAAFSAYNLYSFTATGNGDRKVLGSKFQKIPTTAPVAYPNTLSGYTGGKFYLAALPIEGNTAGIFPGEFVAGPNNSYKSDEDSTLTIGLAKGLLVNDPNYFVLAPLTASYVAGSATAGLSSVTVNANGSFTAVPVANFNGVATFQYNVIQNGSTIATNMATINFKPKNDAPTANNDTFSVAANSAVGNLNVLANDTDIDGDTLTILSKTNTANGTVGISPDKKFITFKPKAGFVGTATFNYTAKDPRGATSTATVTVNVHA